MLYDGAGKIIDYPLPEGVEVGHTHVEADITDLGNYPEKDAAETISGSWTFTADPYLDGAAGTERGFFLSTSGSKRWSFWADNEAEGGGNAGSNFELWAYTDGGALNERVLQINRNNFDWVFGANSAISWGGGTFITSSNDVSQVGHTHVEADIIDLDHTDADAIHDNVSGEINALTEKATPVSADLLIIEDSAASNVKKKVQIGNLPTGGGSSPGLLKAKGTSTSSIANTEVDLPWASPQINTSDCTISGVEITIGADGVYLFDVTPRIQANNRVELIVRTYIDTGGGYAQDTDEIASDYVTRDTDQDTGGTSLSTALDLNSGDKIKFSAEADADGTAVLLTAGTILRIVQL